MGSPSDRRYADTHEWHRLDGELIVIGISQFAVDQLTDVTFAELKPEGTQVEAGGEIGEVESVKTSSDVYSGMAGEIVEVNQQVVDDPSLLNSDPYGEGWLIKLKPGDPAEIDGLLDAAAYDEKNPA
ncbi:MAG: glycine cleavage system protein GcvH [Planctomycetota bacterium]